MLYIREYWHVWAALLLPTLIIGGCASLSPTTPSRVEPVEPGVESHENGWWRAGFQIKWPEDTEPSWHLDLFLSLEIISPVLDQYRGEIILWRFHRRAARDQTGHQFSFIFYCSPDVAQHIFDSIKLDADLEMMKTAGIIVQDNYDDTNRIIMPGIADTSDPEWSPSIRKSWPYFIMGASRMWLDLIKDIAEQNSDRECLSSVEEFQDFYRQVNESVMDIWREEGSQALLHHLNALFGYQPVVIYERRYMKF